MISGRGSPPPPAELNETKRTIFCVGSTKNRLWKADEIALVANPAKMIAPVLVEAHADGGQLIAGAELRRPHQGEGLRL